MDFRIADTFMPLTGFEELTSHQTTIAAHADTVLRGLRVRDSSRPITSKKIEEAIGIKGPALRAIVHYLRTQGHPICSASKGYWYGNSEELDDTIHHLEQRVRSISAAAQALRKTQETAN